MKPLKSVAGFGLVEAVVAIGVIGLVLAGILQILTNSMKVATYTEAISAVGEKMDQTRIVLAGEVCRCALEGKQFQVGSPTEVIDESDGFTGIHFYNDYDAANCGGIISGSGGEVLSNGLELDKVRMRIDKVTVQDFTNLGSSTFTANLVSEILNESGYGPPAMRPRKISLILSASVSGSTATITNCNSGFSTATLISEQQICRALPNSSWNGTNCVVERSPNDLFSIPSGSCPAGSTHVGNTTSGEIICRED